MIHDGLLRIRIVLNILANSGASLSFPTTTDSYHF
jgi:hypothetical protein